MHALLPADPERALSLAYAPRGLRPVLSALWRLDEQLGTIVARTDAAAIGQMRLTWWHEALRTLSTSRPVDPLLIELAGTPAIDPESLLPLVDGWELLLDPLPLPAGTLGAYADLRGGTLFGVGGALLGGDPRVSREAGRAWALADLAFRISDKITAERAITLAPRIEGPLPRALAILAALAARDMRRGVDRPRRQGSPIRVARAMFAGLTGV